jgi:hypothetical protein
MAKLRSRPAPKSRRCRNKRLPMSTGKTTIDDNWEIQICTSNGILTHEINAVRVVNVVAVPANLQPRITRVKADNTDKNGIISNPHGCGRCNKSPGNSRKAGGFHIIPGF